MRFTNCSGFFKADQWHRRFSIARHDQVVSITGINDENLKAVQRVVAHLNFAFHTQLLVQMIQFAAVVSHRVETDAYAAQREFFRVITQTSRTELLGIRRGQNHILLLQQRHGLSRTGAYSEAAFEPWTGGLHVHIGYPANNQRLQFSDRVQVLRHRSTDGIFFHLALRDDRARTGIDQVRFERAKKTLDVRLGLWFPGHWIINHRVEVAQCIKHHTPVVFLRVVQDDTFKAGGCEPWMFKFVFLPELLPFRRETEFQCRQYKVLRGLLYRTLDRDNSARGCINTGVVRRTADDLAASITTEDVQRCGIDFHTLIGALHDKLLDSAAHFLGVSVFIHTPRRQQRLRQGFNATANTSP